MQGSPAAAMEALKVAELSIRGARLHTADDNACLIAYGRKRHLAAAEALAGLGINPPPGWLEEWEISK